MVERNKSYSRVLWGVSALHHDAALCVIIQGPEGTMDFMYASHAERYSRKKNDPDLHQAQIFEALEYGVPDEVFWYESPWLKRWRWLKSKQFVQAFVDPMPKAYVQSKLEKHLGARAKKIKVTHGLHHLSHLYSCLATLPKELRKGQVNGLIVDAIGEEQTTTLWSYDAEKGKHKLHYEALFPFSLGLFYAALTEYVGLKPMEEEYIFMGMAAYGSFNKECLCVVATLASLSLQQGLPEDFRTSLSKFSEEDIAYAAQSVVYGWTRWYLNKLDSGTAVVLGGGVALNCVNNAKLAAESPAPLWLFPNAGDAGACVGAVMQHFPDQPLRFWTAFSGTDMGPLTEGMIDEVIKELQTEKVCGVAYDQAEFGPRALGCRSVLADPRDIQVKQRVNQYKNRQQFRPLAPMVLEGYEDSYFHVPPNVKYAARFMQVVVDVRAEKKQEIPAVVHHDGTARIQIVQVGDPVYPILQAWFKATGCPVLLNTSLNVKGEPLVNALEDALRFESKVGIRVVTGDRCGR